MPASRPTTGTCMYHSTYPTPSTLAFNSSWHPFSQNWQWSYFRPESPVTARLVPAEQHWCGYKSPMWGWQSLPQQLHLQVVLPSAVLVLCLPRLLRLSSAVPLNFGLTSGKPSAELIPPEAAVLDLLYISFSKSNLAPLIWSDSLPCGNPTHARCLDNTRAASACQPSSCK